MANKYYYLVSSLSSLQFSDAYSMDKEDFLDQSQKWLSVKDLEALSKVDINFFDEDNRDPEVLRYWKEHERSLRLLLVNFRKARKESLDSKMPDELKEILSKKNPYIIERELLKLRWDFLDQLEYKYHFDINVLIIYFLKLQIKTRLNIFNKEKGMETFEKLCEVKL